jgi:Mg2+-importing ATPase
MVLLVFAMNVFLKKPVLDSLLFSVSLAVGITPVLLPAIVHVTLSKGAQKLAKNRVIVRKLNAIENLGSMDILCTDKTGTITSGVIRLDRALDVDGNDSEMIRRMAFYNAHFESGIENPLDEAITNSLSFPLDKVSKQGEIPYDFMRKRLSVIVQESSQKTMLITKGAFDQVLSVCSSFQSSVGVSGLTDSVKKKIQMQYESWSNAGYRVLCLAYREIESKEIYSRTDEDHLILVGYLLFRDPPKNGIQEVVKELKESGVGLKIITGDNRYVAKHIAGEIGLNTENILTGDDLDQMKDEALWHLAEKTDLFAEVDPNQKERIISALRKMGHTIGFMGDGINDAPALHAADVGISVENAVDVTKEAADLVLLNQDLNILLTGIRLGRTSFTNTMKYIHITTSANFGNMFSMAGISLLIPFLPMLPMQILLTNFLTDIPAMGISDDSVDDDLIKGHTKWDINFIRRFMVVFGIASSVFDFLTFFFLIRIFKVDESTFQTAWFLESVMTELFILLIIRTRKMFLLSRPSKGLLLSIFAMAAITILLTILPVNHYLGLINLPRSISLTIIGLVVFYVVINEILKKIFYRMNPL